MEIPSWSLTALLTDLVLKEADVELLGFETSGGITLVAKFRGLTASIEAAIGHAQAIAPDLGIEITTSIRSRPDPKLDGVLTQPNAIHALYGHREQFLPTDYPSADKDKTMNKKQEALGILETQGLAAILEATDTMLKAADVHLVGKEKIGAAYVTIVIRGDVDAVKAAIEAGAKAVDGLGTLIAAPVSARPHEELLAILPA